MRFINGYMARSEQCDPSSDLTWELGRDPLRNMNWASDNDVYGGGSQLANRTVTGNSGVDAAHPQVAHRAGAESRSRGAESRATEYYRKAHDGQKNSHQIGNRGQPCSQPNVSRCLKMRTVSAPYFIILAPCDIPVMTIEIL